ncbi:MAG: hypothetical protein IPN58_00060 [Anaerolineales bacterium]|nr:hypothetical protein [Anaerolineales bacterium]
MNFSQKIKSNALWDISKNGDLIALLIFLIQILFMLYRFMPTLQDINLWDEAIYINAGRELINGTLTPFEWNPFVAIFYAFTYLPFKSSPYWMMQSAAVGRVLLFGLMWLGSFLIAKRLSRLSYPLVMAGVLFSMTVLTDILDNPTDALFAAMSGFAFWKLITYYETREEKQLGWISCFLGLAALSRNDGLVLFVIFVVLSLLFLRSSVNKIKHLLYTALPFLIFVFGYFLIYGFVTGNFSLGTRERSYIAFEQGQAELYQENESCQQSFSRCAILEARELYGTPVDNNYSVFTAIRNNPGAMLERVVHSLKVLPELIYSAYGKRTAYMVFFLAITGIFELARKRQFLLLGSLLIWTAYLGVYFLTFFRAGYLQTPYFVVFVLAAIGVTSLVNSIISGRKEYLIWTVFLFILSVIGVYRSLNYLYFNTLVLLGIIWAGKLASRSRVEEIPITLYLIFLAGGMIVRGAYNPPQIQIWGEIPEEQAIVFLQETFPEDSLVAAGAPGAVYAARMDYFEIGDLDGVVTSPEDLYAQLSSLGVQAIYVDSFLSSRNSHIYELIDAGVGDEFEQIFSGRDGSIQVLRVRP